MDGDCFLKYQGNCGGDRGDCNIVSIDECKEDVSGHLLSVHLSREEFSESELILSRAGLFDVSKEQMHLMYICPRHRNSLGRFFRPLKTCQYPAHSGKVKSVKGRYVITVQIAKDIHKLHGKVVAIGSRKY